MQHSILEILLWCLAGLLGAFFIAFLSYGWFRNHNWAKEQRLRKRQGYRYD